jgi:hypothetical protein
VLHIDPFTEDDFRRLDAVRADHCVSIYLPTHTVSREADEDRLLFKNLVKEALGQLSDGGAEKRRISAVAAQLDVLTERLDFWNHMAEGLAVLVTPDSIEFFRLPRSVSAEVEISDRFHLKPLIPLLAFPHTAYLLDITQKEVRFWEVTEGNMHRVEVDGMPASFEAMLDERAGSADDVRMRQAEHRKVRQRQFMAEVEQALRPVLRGRKVPLVLAGVETMLVYYREANTYPLTMLQVIEGNQEHRRRDELAAEVRTIVASRFAAEIRSRLDRIEALRDARMSSTDLDEIARAAREGRVSSIIVDVENEIYGRVARGDGAVKTAARPAASTYDVLDELVGLTLRQGGEVIGVSRDMLPDGVQVAATFRYAT